MYTPSLVYNDRINQTKKTPAGARRGTGGAGLHLRAAGCIGFRSHTDVFLSSTSSDRNDSSGSSRSREERTNNQTTSAPKTTGEGRWVGVQPQALDGSGRRAAGRWRTYGPHGRLESNRRGEHRHLLLSWLRPGRSRPTDCCGPAGAPVCGSRHRRPSRLQGDFGTGESMGERGRRGKMCPKEVGKRFGCDSCATATELPL